MLPVLGKRFVQDLCGFGEALLGGQRRAERAQRLGRSPMRISAHDIDRAPCRLFRFRGVSARQRDAGQRGQAGRHCRMIRRDPLLQRDLCRGQQRLGIEIAAAVDRDERQRDHRLGRARGVAAEAGDCDVERAPAQRRRLGQVALPQPKPRNLLDQRQQIGAGGALFRLGRGERLGKPGEFAALGRARFAHCRRTNGRAQY